MPDWLRDAALVQSPVSPQTMALRLLTALVFGLLVALVYRLGHGRDARDARTLAGTLVLLTVLLAMVTMVIGDSVARAFGLVGALSIVRFRTVVDDTRDTAMVICAVVVGMAIGTGLLAVAAIGLPVVAAAAFALASRRAPTPADPAAAAAPTRTLTVRLGAGQSPDPVAATLAKHTVSWKNTGLATARQGASIDLAYALRIGDDRAAALVAELNTLPGVQGIDLRTPEHDPAD